MGNFVPVNLFLPPCRQPASFARSSPPFNRNIIKINTPVAAASLFQMHPDEYNVSAGIASIRSSGALPDSSTQYAHDGPPESPTVMAQPGFTAYPPPAIPERDPRHDDSNRPAEDSAAIRAVPQFGTTRNRTNTQNTQTGRDRKGSNAPSTMEAAHFPHVDIDMGGDDPPAGPPPVRTPSRQQIMRWGAPPPTPSEWGFDDMGDRRYYPRPSYDYGMPPRPQPPWYGDDPSYYNRPYQRRMSSVRESTEFNGGQGPPRPPRRPRYRGHWDDGESDGESDERPLRKPRKKRSRDRSSDRSSPPPEVIMRLPFTEWMNTTFKGRKSYPSCSSLDSS